MNLFYLLFNKVEFGTFNDMISRFNFYSEKTKFIDTRDSQFEEIFKSKIP